ncbi:MAG: type II toxin-antitoxin system RelE/ParE family toxin [Candidatus Xenobia bacterium]
MARVVWTSTAREDLKAIVGYIAQNSTSYARSFALRLKGATHQVSDSPLSHRPDVPLGVRAADIGGPLPRTAARCKPGSRGG